MTTIALKCSACGGSLTVPAGVVHLVCAFCGTPHLVKNEGNVWFLQREVAEVKAGIARIETGVRELKEVAVETRGRADEAATGARYALLASEKATLAVDLDQSKRKLRTRWVFAIYLALALAAMGVAAAEQVSRSTEEVPLPAPVAFTGAALSILLIPARMRGKVRRIKRRMAEVDRELGPVRRFV
jgi:hypothetical protein